MSDDRMNDEDRAFLNSIIGDVMMGAPRQGKVFDIKSLEGLDPQPALRTMIAYGRREEEDNARIPDSVRRSKESLDAGRVFKQEEFQGHLLDETIRNHCQSWGDEIKREGTFLCLRVVEYPNGQQRVVWLGEYDITSSEKTQLSCVLEVHNSDGINLGLLGSPDLNETLPYGSLEIDSEVEIHFNKCPPSLLPLPSVLTSPSENLKRRLVIGPPSITQDPNPTES